MKERLWNSRSWNIISFRREINIELLEKVTLMMKKIRCKQCPGSESAIKKYK